MKASKAAQFIACHGSAKSDAGDSRIAKAVKVAETDPALKAQLEAQLAFDAEIVKQIEAIEIPAALLKGIEASEQPKAKRVGLAALKQPAFLSVGLAILVVIGVLCYSTYNRMNRFDGQDQVMDLMESTDEMSGVELEPKVAPLGNLGDYLFSKYAFENYRIPSEFSAFKTVGCRVFKKNGARIAQIAVERDNLIFFVFQAQDFGVKLRSRDGWRCFEQGDWAGAMRVNEGTCVMIALRGDKDDIQAILAKLPTKK